ncbi:hypothetical protein CWATWH0402_1991 [Crocosphaera watsonii WH 0402]|uniref:Uncharacterized protein n=1 Tax=Crocosphaera watsonii WH 0402 TaxID=1284629 RepID=T2JYV6_CROWT|nr:hypothetical protein CWATWH0402_1991 [Crocosphaera watsonii WH 0402]
MAIIYVKSGSTGNGSSWNSAFGTFKVRSLLHKQGIKFGLLRGLIPQPQDSIAILLFL